MLFPKILITPHNTSKTGSSFLLHSSSLSSAPLKLTLSPPPFTPLPLPTSSADALISKCFVRPDAV